MNLFGEESSDIVEQELFKSSTLGVIEKLKSELKIIEQMIDYKVIWTEIAPYLQPIRKLNSVTISKAVGVYRIYYKPTMTIMDVGNGNIGNRHQRHRTVFQNNGVALMHKKGGSSGSAVATKMYNLDSDFSNWMFDWCHIGNKELSNRYEIMLIEKYRPEFNMDFMAGK